MAATQMELLTESNRAPRVPAAGADDRQARPWKSHAIIMVVDDDFANVRAVRRLLELGGYSQFVTTTDSTSAMSLLREERPDLVLLDLMMPIVSCLDNLAEMQFDDEL